jgi:hypothetical protein
VTRLTHGDAARSIRGGPTVEYRIWTNMLRRCRAGLRNYGDRGVTVCDRWELFENFLADMGRRPSPDHSLDRIDNDGNYEPGNCRWSTRKEQMRNTRVNRRLTYRGESFTVAEWAERLNINATTIRTRLARGKSIERALSQRSHTRAG